MDLGSPNSSITPDRAGSGSGSGINGSTVRVPGPPRIWERSVKIAAGCADHSSEKRDGSGSITTVESSSRSPTDSGRKNKTVGGKKKSVPPIRSEERRVGKECW